MASWNLNVVSAPIASPTAARFEVRLATSAREIDAAQALRYRVFHDELGATLASVVPGRDVDAFDAVCDHLVILDHALDHEMGGAIVGTYRLLRRSVADRCGGFYSATEFDIAPLFDHPGELLELGRSCVDPAYRNGATMQLLWQGIAAYILKHDISLMFGCASLPGTDIDALAPMLAYLHCHHLAPPALRTRALPDRRVALDRLGAPATSGDTVVMQLGARAAVAGLPPLLKGYLRVGGCIGDGAVIDRAFNTTDVCLIVPMDDLSGKYAKHFLNRTH
ncbi:GNAT family N-acetyltransferase [Azospirillum palustre]